MINSIFDHMKYEGVDSFLYDVPNFVTNLVPVDHPQPMKKDRAAKLKIEKRRKANKIARKQRKSQ